MRVCARIGCSEPLPTHARADALYCGTTCRREAHLQRQGISRPERPKSFRWSRYPQIAAVAVRRGRARYAIREVTA